MYLMISEEELIGHELIVMFNEILLK